LLWYLVNGRMGKMGSMWSASPCGVSFVMVNGRVLDDCVRRLRETWTSVSNVEITCARLRILIIMCEE